MQDFLSDKVELVEETLGGVYGMLKDVVGVLPIVGEEARLKGKYASSQADAIVGSASSSGTSILVSSCASRL